MKPRSQRAKALILNDAYDLGFGAAARRWGITRLDICDLDDERRASPALDALFDHLARQIHDDAQTKRVKALHACLNALTNLVASPETPLKDVATVCRLLGEMTVSQADERYSDDETAIDVEASDASASAH